MMRYCAGRPGLGRKKSRLVWIAAERDRPSPLFRVFRVFRGLFLLASFALRAGRYAGLAKLDDGTSGNKDSLTVLLFQFHISR